MNNKRTYINHRTGLKIELNLDETLDKFYLEAVKKFELGTEWIQFEKFVFGNFSPIYKNQKSHLDVIKTPLYVALEDMWLELGIRQGLVKS